MIVELICYLIAFVLFVLTGFNVVAPRVNLIGLGLAAMVFPLLLDAFEAVG